MVVNFLNVLAQFNTKTIIKASEIDTVTSRETFGIANYNIHNSNSQIISLSVPLDIELPTSWKSQWQDHFH